MSARCPVGLLCIHFATSVGRLVDLGGARREALPALYLGVSFQANTSSRALQTCTSLSNSVESNPVHKTNTSSGINIWDH